MLADLSNPRFSSVSPRLRASPLSAAASARSRKRVRVLAMGKPIKGKTVAVIGASRGIGQEFVSQLLQKGNTVFAGTRSGRVDAKLGSNDKLEVLPIDVTEPESIAAFAQNLAKKTKKLDVVINNAGVASWEGLGEVTKEAMLRCFCTNSIGPLLTVQQLMKAGLLGRGSVIANITSKMGSVSDNTSGGTYAYRASKAAENIITKSLALDLEPRGITVSLLHPGYVRTDMTGGNGLISVSESVAGLIAVLESDKPLAGHWYDYKFDEIGW